MNNPIINYISKYIPLTEEEIEIINEQNLIRFYKKNEVLLAEGEYPKECYFVLNGCVRAYYLLDGEERNTEFYVENQSITPVGYQTKQPSEYYLACLEDCVLALGSDERNQKLLEKVPKLTSMIMQMSSEILIQKTIEFDEFKTYSPEQRYLNLLEKRPDLVNRIPLYHLASYLGITQVSLSRIRKRISVN